MHLRPVKSLVDFVPKFAFIVTQSLVGSLHRFQIDIKAVPFISV